MAKRQVFVESGRRGGLARVPKGVSMLSPAERKQRAREAAQARWGRKKTENSLASGKSLKA
jgi:hypothetical protein